jgi:hypothetical protein
VADVEKWAGYVRNTKCTQGDVDCVVKVWRLVRGLRATTGGRCVRV